MSSTRTIPILISTIGTIPKSLKSNLKELDLDENLYKLIANDRPDIILVKKKEKTAILIDESIPNNNNLRQKYAEKISKY